MRAIKAPYKSDSLLVGAIHFIVQFLQKLGALFGTQLALQFFQRQSHDVVVVCSSELWIRSDIEPQFVHEFDVLGAHARGVWSKGVLANGTVRRTNFQGQSRARLRQALPGVSGQLGLFIRSELVRKAADNPAGV